MSFQYTIPGVGFVGNQLIGQEVRAAVGDSITRGLDALDAGNNIEAAQAFSQAAAVLAVAIGQTVFLASGTAAIGGLGPVFQGMSSNKGIVANFLEKYATPLFPQKFHPTEIAKIVNWGTSTAAGASAGWWTNELINKLNSLNLGGKLYDTLPDSINQSILAGINWFRRSDPLILDLDGDGIELSTSSSTVLFDHNADGLKTGTQWAKADDGILVRDLNGNGTIDSGRELFGDQTLLPSGQQAYNGGFEALRPLDSDASNMADGIINAADTAYASLQIRRDLNQDGISQTNELQTLAESGVTAIQLTQTPAQFSQGKSTFTLTVAGVDANGEPVSTSTTQTAQNVNFTQNTFYREFSDQAAWLAQQLMASKTRQGCHISLFDQRIARCQIRKNARFLRKKVRCDGVIDQF